VYGVFCAPDRSWLDLQRGTARHQLLTLLLLLLLLLLLVVLLLVVPTAGCSFCRSTS
jgi:hypothetical protein